MRQAPHPAPAMSSFRASVIGFSAILMWSSFALLTVASGKVPPFQLAALTFSIGGAFGAAWVWRARSWHAFRQAPHIWAIGVGGLFGYHSLYFLSLRSAPAAEAGLINFLWPLLIVLFSGLLPGERLRWYSVAGALLGLAGTAALFLGKGSTLTIEFAVGYAAAFFAALVWSSYSVLSRLFADVPTAAVAGFCVATAVLATVCHLAFEVSVWPENTGQWLAILALGVGPVGIAFYAWDIGMKRGDIRLLGVASYATPIMSTSLLVVAGVAEARATLALAALLITSGGLLAAKNLLRKRASS